ncbi:MAG: NTF2-like N-terminal transpeptidase domain-containing protein [Terriglobales bacterium]
MTTGRLLAIFVAVATGALIVVGTVWPVQSAVAMAGAGASLLSSSSSAQAAVENLAGEIGRQDWERAYSSLANKSEFSETEFVRDLTGNYASLRTYATLDSSDLRPLHASADEAQIQLKLRWSTVVGTFSDTRTLQVVRTDDHWAVSWPIVKEPRVPPQVIPVNYLRWDVIYRGPADDWGAQDVEAPHVRIIDMHPVDRSAGVVLMGELLNEDVVPAFVTVKATLLAKDGSVIASEDSFDKISHVLLPKQVTPFLITFHDVALSQVDSVHMAPSAILIAASADPVIEIEDQRLNPAPEASFTGKLINQSGQVVNVAHVLGTLYDKDGQLVWVADQYVDRALLPETPISFAMSIPADIASKVSSERAITATYSSGRFQ